MRSAAAQTIHEYDMRPANGDIYVCDVVDRGGKMMKALREWEKKRGLVFSYRNKFIPPKQKPEPKTENAKPKPVNSRPITVQREPLKRGPKPKYTEEERIQIKRERNKKYHAKNSQKKRTASKEWRANRTPEQIEKCKQQLREWRARKRAAKQSGSVQAAGVPLPNAPVS